MKRIIIIAAVVGLVLATFTASSAHLRTDRNWAAVEVPIGVNGIRPVQMDGDISEWDNIPSVFWVTQDDLIEVARGGPDPDAANLAERIIFGWSSETNLVYFMEDRFDDLWYATQDGTHETVEIAFDADHSAEAAYVDVGSEGLDPERWEGATAQNIRYQLFKGEGSEIWLWGGGQWAAVEPYSGVRWSVDGEAGGSASLQVEMWFTPFDDLPASSTGPDDPDLIVHTLQEGDIVGIGFAVQDDDNGPGSAYSGYWTNSGDIELYFRATSLVDYTLLGLDRNIWVSDATAVEADAWGRIKASFSN